MGSLPISRGRERGVVQGSELEGWIWKAVLRLNMNHHTEGFSLSGWLQLKQIELFHLKGRALTDA